MRRVGETRLGRLVGLLCTGLCVVAQLAWGLSHGPNDVRELVRGNTAFALALYDQVRGEPGNLVLSPLSVSTALGMTYAGAAGETAAQMAEVLRFTLPAERAHMAFDELLAELDGTDRPYELALANALWGQEGHGFLHGFLELTRLRYGAGLQEVDFRRDAQGARRAINAWVAERTRERIAELLAPGAVGVMTRLVLVNAIYFYGDWALEFDPDRTRREPFVLSVDETVEVPMMRQTETFPYAEFDQLQLLELPYEGEELSMVVLLPAPDSDISELESELTAERLAEWMGALGRHDVRVHLPKFTVRKTLGLSSVLSQMGMPLAFSQAADFSAMTGQRDLFVNEVVHEAFIEVDEKGTEAAAATAVIMGLTALPPLEPAEFRADRPFLFLIRHRPTGSILFMGRVVDPR